MPRNECGVSSHHTELGERVGGCELCPFFTEEAGGWLGGGSVPGDLSCLHPPLADSETKLLNVD